MKPLRPFVVFATLSCVAHAVVAGEAPIDEVVVRATRNTVVTLAKEARRAEHRFYDLYNQLNTVRDYAVNCRDEASTGSRFTWDGCQPVFETKAQTAEGAAFGRMIQSANASSGGAASPGVPAPPASVAISAGRPDFQKHVTELTRENPELTRRLNEYGEAIKRYQSAYRSYHGKPDPSSKPDPGSKPPGD